MKLAGCRRRSCCSTSGGKTSYSRAHSSDSSTGESTSLLCGGTLALNQNGELLAWARKPGTQPTGTNAAAVEEQGKGAYRENAFLESLARRIRSGRIGTALESEAGLLPKAIPPLTAQRVDGALRFELSPHFGIRDDEDDVEGGRAWQISS